MIDNQQAWIPEIFYEEEVPGKASPIPFILVPEDQEMPAMLFIWEHAHTGEFEPGSDGEALPIVDAELHQFARMDILKERLSGKDYDKVRLALRLKPLREATRLGSEITERAKAQAALKVTD
ncbi:MAG: hypothetical protein CMB80_28720 [Flammeovirgaceae bacterium]|nr:hypothetical protein [Flammeovirgaceae bacterium]